MKSDFQCGQCMFWEPAMPLDPSTPVPSQARGNCRRRAPVRVADGHRVEPGWPPTLAHDGCGDYERDYLRYVSEPS